ncbi:hypothetical protein D2V17_06015 [Aurantiacibacter xanthus]|uniref:Uracil-DNA glycosylase-like domain-containing protein n=1 Tax=Aurantiacibacter xanthus TaxID=1784712 RepID=A0A3A1P7E3_9SPHN|nr:hypothetical protein [Aurantiacibacter xanthus]RIV89567.1 hypothetical protein D2V17_06015 [Aurantiacibacter xanthus]
MIATRARVKGGAVLGFDNSSAGTFAGQLAAINAWWADAGVDHLFDDEPQALLREKAASPEAMPKAVERSAEAAAQPVPSFDASTLPTSLEAFASWWLDPATELPLAHGRRIAARGVAAAPLMVLVPMPEANDGDRLLDGEQGRLIANVLRALGLAEEQVYFASALPCPTTMPDWPGLARAGLAAITAHHIALAAPERVLVLGDAMGQMLGLTQGQGQLTDIPALAARAPEHLLAHPRQRARLWRALLDWMPRL